MSRWILAICNEFHEFLQAFLGSVYYLYIPFYALRCSRFNTQQYVQYSK